MPSFAPSTAARSQPIRPVRCRSLLPTGILDAFSGSGCAPEGQTYLRFAIQPINIPADPALNFAGILFSPAISFQVGVPGKLADFLLDCSVDFVELACCLIVRARFHHEFLLRSEVGFS